MSTSTTSSNCPNTIPVPFTVTVNTSGTSPTAATGHSLVDTHAGFTRISEFTLSPVISAQTGTPAIEDHFPHGISNSIAKWDFGDGYTLSGTDAFTAKHIYNVPGIYTVTVFLYDKNSNAYLSTLTETISVFNYTNTHIAVQTTNITQSDGINARNVTAGQNKTFNLETTASWQDIPDPNEPQTLFFTSSGSKAKPYDFNNKYAHIIPYNAFYDDDNNIINNVNGLKAILYPHYFYIETDNTIKECKEKAIKKNKGVLLYSSTDEYLDDITTVPTPIKFNYYDDIPTDQINLLIRLDTSKHRLKNFFVDDIDIDINNSNKNFFETDIARPVVKDTSTINSTLGNRIGIPIKVITPYTSRLSFTSTGMQEMSSIQYKRQGDKFQVFVALADDKLNIGKYYDSFRFSNLSLGATNPPQDRQFAFEWSDGSNILTSNLSSLCTEYFPFDKSSNVTTLSSFAYLNINPVSAGTWSLNVTGRLDSFSSNPASAAQGKTLDYDNGGPYGPVSINVKDDGLITGSYTFTVFPSTNDVEIYKINEDTDYAKIIKSYRFQSLLHEYDKLFDGIFTSFVGQASSSPTSFGKTIFEKIANFTMNNSDVDFCDITNLNAFYQFFNEDIDFTTPNPPPELKRLYNLFSIKISKLLGDYERFDTSFHTQFYTSSAASRNIDLNNPIDPATYTVTAGTKFVARQKFNNEFILINPQKVPTIRVDGSSSGVSTTYALNKYNVYSNWGWPLDTTISGASGLDLFYEFYPYTTYNTTSASSTIQNNIIDFTNKYNTVTRSSSSLSANWDPEGGIIFKNLDYQIRKGLQL